MFVEFFREKHLLAIDAYIIGASLSEPHTSESNGGFSYLSYVVP